MVLAKNKFDFFDGAYTTSRAWERVNNVVIGWILVVLEESFAKNILSYKTV